MEKTLIQKNGIIYINDFSKYTLDEYKYKELWYIADHKPNCIEDFNRISKLSKKKIFQDSLGTKYNNPSHIENTYSSW